MNFDIREITGKIIENSEVVGTGFLVNNDLFVTARHNVHKNRHGKPSEKEIIIKFDYNEVKGKTLNLEEAYERKIDIVFIKLNESIFDLNFIKVIKSSNSFKNYEFKSYGYPKEKSEGHYLEGIVFSDEKIDNNTDICLNLKDEYFLSGYHGLSGAPIYINDFIVGILIAQETERKLFGISFCLIEENLESLPEDIFPLEEKELKNIFLKTTSQISSSLDNSFFYSHLNEAFSIAGPRYSQEINIENSALKNLQIFSGQSNFLETLKEKIKKLSYLTDCLKDCNKKNSYSKSYPFSKESVINLVEIEKNFKEILEELKDLIISGQSEEKIDFFDQLDANLTRLVEKLKIIFKLELVLFEEEYGKEKFEDKRWRGFMASYQCSFPAANLDNIKDLMGLSEELKVFFSSNPLKLYFSKTLLLKGRGGIGKTHSLCDIINCNIKNNVPSLIFFGQYFRDKSPEEVILEKLSLNNVDFESLLYKLDNIGDRTNKKILICIDAINETSDKTYWNNYLISFTEKIKKYKYIKLIISCRSLYLDEILDTDISKRYLIEDHRGFEEVESKAIKEYFKYYNLNIPHADKMRNEFSNPLFLKLYCEVLSENQGNNSNFNIDSLSSLFESFFKTKNEKISKKFSDYVSPRDNIVFECVLRISNTMKGKNSNYLERTEVKKIIKKFLTEELEEDKLKSKLVLDELILENILKEDIFEIGTLSFSFERFFDYLIAKNIINLKVNHRLEKSIHHLKNNGIYKGTLELLMILYKEKYGKELIEEYKLKEPIFYELFLLSLPWRKSRNIDDTTKSLFYYCLKRLKNQKINRASLFTLYELSLKENCSLNAEYFHNFFKDQRIEERDNFLGYWMLKSYENNTIINRIINNSIYLREKNVDLGIIKLWIIILGWFTSLNDIYIRDRASKGLTNLLKIYPEITFYTIEKFNDIDDDYIQERLWGAIYASLILNKDEERIKATIEEINSRYIKNGNFPENVLLRDLLRNIAELARTIDVLIYDIELFRPPYKSENIEKIDISFDAIPKEYKNLFWNCTKSDFGIYTVPSEVENYGFSKKEVGKLIYNEIINNYDLNQIFSLDDFIDRTYGSLRNRDESVERVSKKYQNITIKKILGRIFDNYSYNPKWRYDNEKEIIPNEQGNKFRNIDLTSLPYEKLDYDFLGNSLKYDFRKVTSLSYQEWFAKEDISELIPPIIENIYLDEEYLLLKGHIDIEKINGGLGIYPKQQLWFQIKSYLVKNGDTEKFNDWVKDKHFWGQWMPTGYEQLYEGWIGEYPWSASYINIFEDEEKTLNGDIKITPTINDFNNEKDSQFCKPKIGTRFRFPGEVFFKKLKLEWNGQNVYFYESKPFFIIGSGQSENIYVNKSLLNEFLEKNGLAIVWTVLGEKRVIQDGINNDFIGNAEFSQTFKYSNKVLPNHCYYKVIDSNGKTIIETLKN